MNIGKRSLHMACIPKARTHFFHSTQGRLKNESFRRPWFLARRVLYPFKKIIYKQAACRSDSRIRHLFAEQGTHIALAVGQTSDSRIRPTQMMLPNCFYFVRWFFRIGFTAKFQPIAHGLSYFLPVNLFVDPIHQKQHRHAQKRGKHKKAGIADFIDNRAGIAAQGFGQQRH